MPSLIIHNAHLISFHDGAVKGHDTLVVDDGKISAIGSWEQLSALAGPGTELIDAGGKTLLPGFNDTHIHIWKVGNLKTHMLDLRGCASRDEMLSMLQGYALDHPESPWIVARGFNEATWTDSRMPTRHDLDKVIPDRPVYVIRTCAHIAIANTKALEKSGIGPSTKAPSGGVILQDESGVPTGQISETALGLVTRHIPPHSKEDLKAMVRAAREELYRFGITAATDPAVDPLLLETYHEMNRDGELGFRLHALPMLLPDGGEERFPIPAAFSSDHFHVNAVKFFSDGGLSGATAALKGHYKGSLSKGILRLQGELYIDLCRRCMERGLGVATHAIGDAAIEFVIDAYKKLHAGFPSMIKRIEHLGLPEKQHLADMSIHGISTSMQTIFIQELGRNFINSLDESYLARCYPVRSVLGKGILMALSSDAPVVRSFDPLRGIEAAINRKTLEGELIAPDEAITIDQALRAYTFDAARISGRKDIGSLELGNKADLILLNRDPTEIDSGNLSQIKVEKTFVGGRKVWGL